MERFLNLLVAACLLSVPIAVFSADTASITVDAKLEGSDGVLEVTVACKGRSEFAPTISIPAGGSNTFIIPLYPDVETTCRVSAAALPGQDFSYLGDGGSETNLDGDGCRFSAIRPGHSNFCQVRAVSRETSLTAYKRWIGTSEPESDVRVTLECDGNDGFRHRAINSDKPGRWTFSSVPADGLLCRVSEEESEIYTADVSDCRELLIAPGKEETCTIVNTKVVKMIEMLNRYGLALMIGVFMVAGMMASRKALA